MTKIRKLTAKQFCELPLWDGQLKNIFLTLEGPEDFLKIIYSCTDQLVKNFGDVLFNLKKIETIRNTYFKEIADGRREKLLIAITEVTRSCIQYADLVHTEIELKIKDGNVSKH